MTRDEHLARDITQDVFTYLWEMPPPGGSAARLAAPGEPDVTIIVNTIDLCRLAARRLLPRDLPATITGDRELWDLVLGRTGRLRSRLSDPRWIGRY